MVLSVDVFWEVTGTAPSKKSLMLYWLHTSKAAGSGNNDLCQEEAACMDCNMGLIVPLRRFRQKYVKALFQILKVFLHNADNSVVVLS